MYFYDNVKLVHRCDNLGFTSKDLWAPGQKQKCQTSEGRIVCIVSAIEWCCGCLLSVRRNEKVHTLHSTLASSKEWSMPHHTALDWFVLQQYKHGLPHNLEALRHLIWLQRSSIQLQADKDEDGRPEEFGTKRFYRSVTHVISYRSLWLPRLEQWNKLISLVKAQKHSFQTRLMR